MEGPEVVAARHARAARFQEIVEQLLSGVQLDMYGEDTDVSLIFEEIASNLMIELPARQIHWFDGVVDLSVNTRKLRQPEFVGEVWGSNHRTHWKEEFRSRVTDKRIAPQGMEIFLWIGDDRAQGDLNTAFGTKSD